MTAVPAPPPGYVVTYSENFTKAPNLGAWHVQPNGNAPVVLSHRFGLGVELTAPEQWSEVANTGAVIGPSSFMTALMYVPPGPKNQVANWPALWSTGTTWPKGGEIDILEGTHGQSCFKAHYGPDAAHEIGGSGCNGATGWVQIVMWRSERRGYRDLQRRQGSQREAARERARVRAIPESGRPGHAVPTARDR